MKICNVCGSSYSQNTNKKDKCIWCVKDRQNIIENKITIFEDNSSEYEDLEILKMILIAQDDNLTEEEAIDKIRGILFKKENVKRRK